MATVDRPSPHSGLLDPEGVPWLENGERMDAAQFLRRYEHTQEHFHAELVEGIVYVVSSPLRNRHGRSSSHLGGRLFLYSASTPGSEAQDNTTTVLGDQSVPQPDSALLIRAEYGGQTHDGSGDDDYTYGAPELVVEVAYSTRSIDLHGKLRDYERAGVREYLVFDLLRNALHAFGLRVGRFEPVAIDPDGVFHSPVFPGLWLDGSALFAGDKPGLIATLNRGLATAEHAAFVEGLERRRDQHS